MEAVDKFKGNVVTVVSVVNGVDGGSALSTSLSVDSDERCAGLRTKAILSAQTSAANILRMSVVICSTWTSAMIITEIFAVVGWRKIRAWKE